MDSKFFVNSKRVKILIAIFILAAAFTGCAAAGDDSSAALNESSGTTGGATGDASTAAAGKPAASASVPPAASGDAMYGIGSVSKIFTAAAMMKLKEAGLVDLNAPVTEYIPEFEMADPRYVEITPAMLLGHSSGLFGSMQKDAYLLNDKSAGHHDAYLNYLKGGRLKHDPGERSIYCNEGYTLAEILIERVSGMSYTEFIERELTAPLGLSDIRTPQSDFDYDLLADIYLGDNALLPQTLGAIGSGGIYSTMKDLCRFSTIFMDGADGSILSAASVSEMAQSHNKTDAQPSGADSIFNYGFGWDSVDTYPYNKLGIQALSKGGATISYYSNLTVLPEYNLAAAVSASGSGGIEQLIAQEIILAVLEEEGLIPPDAVPELPAANYERAKIPDEVKVNAGVYDTGALGEMLQLEFTDDALLISPFATRNERVQTYIYNTDGAFVSADGVYIGALPGFEKSYGVSWLTFGLNRLYTQTYMEVSGMGRSAISSPVAEKLPERAVPDEAAAAWDARNDKEYLLISDRYSSALYIFMPVAKTLTDGRAPGYVTAGVYKGAGAQFPTAKITDAYNAEAFIATPVMVGRDSVDLSVTWRDGVEYINFNGGDSAYMDAANAEKFSSFDGAVNIGASTVWADVDAGLGGKIIRINAPGNGAWFAYDDRMNCVATSLEKNPRRKIILPEGGRMAFAGDPGAEFSFAFE